MTIGDLARRAGVGVETVHFYQRSGLLAEPPRKKGSHRMYSADALEELRFVRRCAGLGFTLKDIAMLMRLKRSTGSTCADMRVRVATTAMAIEVKLQALEVKHAALTRILSMCKGKESLDSCRLYAALADSDA